MKQYFMKIVISNLLLRKVAIFCIKQHLIYTYGASFGRNVTIGFSTRLEGKNSVGNNCSITNCYLGYGSYISDNSTFIKTFIGRYSSIGPNVYCVFGKHPANTFVSTHPAFFSTRNQVGFTYTNKQLFEEYADTVFGNNNYSIEIGNDVWIGAGAMIFDGVKIGDGAIVAAGAVVNKDVESYSIVGGIPSKFIRYRFDKNLIEFLKQIKWWQKDKEWIKNNFQYFTNIDNFYKRFKNE